MTSPVVDPDLELRGGRDGDGFLLLTLPTFLPFVIFFPSFTQSKGGNRSAQASHLDFPLVSTGLVLLCHAMLTCHVTGVDLGRRLGEGGGGWIH